MRIRVDLPRIAAGAGGSDRRWRSGQRPFGVDHAWSDYPRHQVQAIPLPPWVTGATPAGRVGELDLDLRIESIDPQWQPLANLQAQGIGLERFSDCGHEQCPGDGRNPQPLWWAQSNAMAVSVVLDFKPTLLGADSALYVRLAAVAPSAATGPLLVKCELQDSAGKWRQATDIEVNPPLVGGQRGEQAPIVLRGSVVKLAGRHASQAVSVRAMRLAWMAPTPAGLVVGGVWGR